MQCVVNGREIAAELLARHEMNFGQVWPEPARPVDYRITIETPEFIRRFNDVYEQAARDDKADIPYHSIGEVPLLDRWQELNYPPLEFLLDENSMVLEGLIQWLAPEILDRIVPGPAVGLPRFLINTIDRAIIDNGR